jgi:Uma2 family endonuclease
MRMFLSSPTLDDRTLYPLHKEDDVTETPLHENVVGAHLPGDFVTGNVCIDREPGNFQHSVAPDLFVARGTLPEPDPRVYHIWQDPPIVFVAEIGSRSTRHIDEGLNLPLYEQVLGIDEHLFADVETGAIRLRRLRPGGYEIVVPQSNGRLRSEELGVEFAMDEGGFVWVYAPDGRRPLTDHEESARREEAEAQVREEARQRQAAESRAAEEAARRAALEREWAELRNRLQERDGSGDE